jgi:hypothetical protein
LDLREILNPLFKSLHEGISEFTFANIYLFRKAHSYGISRLKGGLYVIKGTDEITGTNEAAVKSSEANFFMLPFGLPESDILDALFKTFLSMKAVSETQASILSRMGYRVVEDRDNFDYLYLKTELESLQGRKYHRKKNLVNAFINNHSYEGKPLLEEHHGDALEVLELWRNSRQSSGDYGPAKEAVEMAEKLSLCGGIYYVDKKPAAFTLGEEIAGGDTFVIHFEKADSLYRGIYQFINLSFASILPEKYVYINREQDIGDQGLRQAKMSYKPHAFVKKYRALTE